MALCAFLLYGLATDARFTDRLAACRVSHSKRCRAGVQRMSQPLPLVPMATPANTGSHSVTRPAAQSASSPRHPCSANCHCCNPLGEWVRRAGHFVVAVEVGWPGRHVSALGAKRGHRPRGRCQAEVSSGQGRVLPTPGSCAVSSAFSNVVRDTASYRMRSGASPMQVKSRRASAASGNQHQQQHHPKKRISQQASGQSVELYGLSPGSHSGWRFASARRRHTSRPASAAPPSPAGVWPLRWR